MGEFLHLQMEQRIASQAVDTPPPSETLSTAESQENSAEENRGSQAEPRPGCCYNHPGEDAAWECDDCGKRLCDACVKPIVVKFREDAGEKGICIACGGLAINRHRVMAARVEEQRKESAEARSKLMGIFYLSFSQIPALLFILLDEKILSLIAICVAISGIIAWSPLKNAHRRVKANFFGASFAVSVTLVLLVFPAYNVIAIARPIIYAAIMAASATVSIWIDSISGQMGDAAGALYHSRWAPLRGELKLWEKVVFVLIILGVLVAAGFMARDYISLANQYNEIVSRKKAFRSTLQEGKLTRDLMEKDVRGYEDTVRSIVSQKEADRILSDWRGRAVMDLWTRQMENYDAMICQTAGFCDGKDELAGKQKDFSQQFTNYRTVDELIEKGSLAEKKKFLLLLRYNKLLE